MICIIRKKYETEDEDWAFSDGVKAGIKAMCKKYNIDESDVYKKECQSKNQTQQHDNSGKNTSIAKSSSVEETPLENKTEKSESCEGFVPQSECSSEGNFNLKEKKRKFGDKLVCEVTDNKNISSSDKDIIISWLRELDEGFKEIDKEFIRRLKEEMCRCGTMAKKCYLCKNADKLSEGLL